jgi:DNA-binding NtrC family response regulator
MDVSKKYLIFVVEDNKMYNHLIMGHLNKNGFSNVKSFSSGIECFDAVKNKEIPNIVIQDYFMNEMNGLEVLQRVKKINPNTEFIFLTANEDLTVAVSTMKSGAYDYVIKDNVALDKVVNKIQKIIRVFELERKNKQIQFLVRMFLLLLFVIAISSILIFALDIFHIM